MDTQLQRSKIIGIHVLTHQYMDPCAEINDYFLNKNSNRSMSKML